MKLVHCNLLRQIILEECGITQWIIENPTLFGNFVQELYMQTEGVEGRFVLSDDDKELNIAKKMEIIMNPLQLNINNKKILNKLYIELSEAAYAEEYFLETQKIMNLLQKYFYQLEQKSEYALEIEPEIGITEIFKALGVRIMKMGDDYFSNLVQYLKIMVGLLGKPIVVIVNATAYLDQNQMKMLQEMAMYEELRVLFIESSSKEIGLKVPKYIIDADMCEI